MTQKKHLFRFSLLLLCHLTTVLSGQQDNSYQKWFEANGERYIEAKFVSLTGDGELSLEKHDGTIVTVAIEKFDIGSAQKAKAIQHKLYDIEKTEPKLDNLIPPIGESVESVEDENKIDDLTKYDDRKSIFWKWCRPFYNVNAESDTVRALAEVTGDDWKQDFYWPLACLIIAAGSIFVFIWWIVLCFREGVWWGIVSLIPFLNGIAFWVFVKMHQEEATGPLVASFLLGIFLMVSFLFAPSWAFEAALLEESLNK